MSKGYSINLIKLLNALTMKGIDKTNLTLIPAGSNYLIEHIYKDGKIIAHNIVEVYSDFHKSETRLCDHLTIQNIQLECRLLFTVEQYQYLNKLLSSFSSFSSLSNEGNEEN